MSSELLSVIKKIAKETGEAAYPADAVMGIVVSASPLRISIDQKIILTEKNLILCRQVTDFSAKIAFTNSGIKQKALDWNLEENLSGTPYKIAFTEAVPHEICVYNGLLPGEKVIMLRAYGGQKYIVIDRLVTL